jgi:hypothetical protein
MRRERADAAARGAKNEGAATSGGSVRAQS